VLYLLEERKGLKCCCDQIWSCGRLWFSSGLYDKDEPSLFPGDNVPS